MRLRLRVQRNELPAVNTLWPLTDIQQKHTIAQLLEAINQTFPLETDKWGLEDYVVTVASYECLHYHEIGAVCKDEDEVVVRPLTYAEVRARTLMGRSQISGDGRKLEDGIAFGRPLLRAPIRPEVRIPARKRKRGSEEEDDEGDKRVRFLHNGEESEQTEGVSLPNHKTVVVVSGKDDDSDEDEDDEEDDHDFELEDAASSSEAESDSSEASSSSSESDSSDSTASSDSSDSSSSSSSDSSSDESSAASTKAPRAKKLASGTKPIPQTVTKTHANTLPGTTKKPQQTTPGAPQSRTIPYEGNRKTQERNARRRDSKKLAYLKENNILPPNADLMTLRAWEKSADWTTEAPGLTKHMNTTDTSSSTMHGTEDPSEEVDLATQRQQLLDSIASGGVEISTNGNAVKEEGSDEGPEVHSNRLAAEHAALTERLYRENINSMTGDSASPTAANRRGLDLSSAERLLYGSLGVRAPKTQEQKDALQKRLAARQGTAAPKSKPKSQSKQPEIAVVEAEEEDPDAWLQRIDLRAVECCDEGVELSTPPFPFYQRWDSQYRKKKNRNMATYANAPRKRRRGNQGNMVGELVESYDKYNQDGYGDVLDYDGDGAGDEKWDQDDLAEQQLLNEANADLPVDDFPALPENIASLAALTSDDARSGDYVTYTELVCSPATSWQPLMLTRTVQLMEKVDDGWKVKLAVRDLPPKEYDADGKRVYGKFEMEEMSDDEDGAEEDERIKVMAFADLNDAKLLERAEVEAATAAGDEAKDQ